MEHLGHTDHTIMLVTELILVINTWSTWTTLTYPVKGGPSMFLDPPLSLRTFISYLYIKRRNVLRACVRLEENLLRKPTQGSPIPRWNRLG